MKLQPIIQEKLDKLKLPINRLNCVDVLFEKFVNLRH